MTIASHTRFVGIDVGKYDLVLATGGEDEIRTHPNTPHGIAALVSTLRRSGPVHVVLEATGGYEWPLWDALDAAGISVRQVSPAEVRAFARSCGRSAKTDAIDARTLAAFAAFRPEAGRRLRPGSLRQIRRLAAARRQRVADRVRLRGRRERAPDEALEAYDQELQDLLDRQIAALDAEIARAITEDETLRQRHALLRSIPGVGPVLAATLLAEMPELGALSDKAAGALVGLAPVARDSGRFRGQRFIGGGRKPVRDVLYMAATVAVRHNADLAAVFETLRGRGQPYKKAITAIARRLIVLANAILKRGTPWQTSPPT